MHHGQEIYTFFNNYGIYGLVGIILSTVLMGIIIYKTFKTIIENKIDTYQKFIINILPEKLRDYDILVFTIENIINIFLLISFNIMIAGFSTYFLQELNVTKWIGAIIIATLALVTFSKSINGVIKINTYLIPIIILLITFLGIKRISASSIIQTTNNNSLYWIVSSILYASYNSITLIPILISLKKYVTTKKEAKITTFYVIIIMFILSIIIYLLMNTFLKEIKNIEIPIIYIANTLGACAKYIYGITVLIAIFTTAISTGYGFLTNVTKSKKNYLKCATIICILSTFIGQIGFSNLISILYPVFGYLGIIQIIFLILT